MDTEVRLLIEREEELRTVLSYARLVATGNLKAEHKILINQERAGIFRAIDCIKLTGCLAPDRYVIPDDIERIVQDLLRRMRSKRWKISQEEGII